MERTSSPETPVLVIKPSKGALKLNELWHYRELLYFLVWRDIKVRYKQTFIGAAWAVLQPLFSMVVFSIFFGGLAGISSDGFPYPLFNFSALVPWTFFANGLSQSSNSLVGGAHLLKKVYFPRLVMPIAGVFSSGVDSLIAFGILLLLMLLYGVLPTLNIIFLPLFVLLALATALGVGLWLAAINVRFRDVRYIMPFLLQMWMFATPVVYPSSLIPENWRPLYALNPMVGVIEGFRWALLGADTAPSPIILISTIVALLLLVSGALYFRRMESTFADEV